MNKADAHRLVYRLTADSLRRLAGQKSKWSKMRGWPMSMSDSDKSKIEREFIALATKLELKIREPEPIEVHDFKDETDANDRPV